MHTGIENKVLGFGAVEKFTYGKSGGFNGSSYLSRAFTTSPTWTFSAWVKRSSQASLQSLFGTAIQFNAADKIVAGGLTTQAVFRDPTAWYHIYVSNDGLYVNGVFQGAVTTAALTNPAVGAGAGNLNALLNEVHFVDGAVAPISQFGRFDNNGIWTARKYTGSHGVKGFYLDFSTATADASGNGNTMTATGTVALYLDNPAVNASVANAQGTYQGSIGANGTLSVTGSTTAYGTYGTLNLPSTGKWVAQAQNTTGQDEIGFSGIITAHGQTGRVFVNGTAVATPGTSTNMCEFGVDVDAKTVTFGLNGSIKGTWNYTDPGYFAKKTLGAWDGSTATGQTVYYYTGGLPDPYPVITGYKTLAVGNFPAPDLADPTTIIRAVTWTGTGSPQNVVVQDSQGIGWQPDLVIIKCTSAAGGAYWFDSVRGPTKYLDSTSTALQVTDANSLTAFNVDGFSVGTTLSVSGATYVAYCFKKKPGFFDIVSYTGAGAAMTFNHSLGNKPGFMVLKQCEGAVNNWTVYHQAMGATQRYLLNSSAAPQTSSAIFGNTAPSASTVTLGAGEVSTAGTHIAYLWADHDGVQQFRGYSYNGWGSAGYTPAVPMNISSQILIARHATGACDWAVKDTALNPVNPASNTITLNTTPALYTNNCVLDLQAAGICLVGSSALSGSGSYIYAAWAIQALGGEGSHCATAR